MTMLTRRRWLQLAGASGALAPFLPSLEAFGQGARPPRRLVIIWTPHGTIYKNWQPIGTETAFELSPILKPLEAHRSNLVILDGLKINHSTVRAPSHTEGMGLVWTGSNLSSGNAFQVQQYNIDWVEGPSVDQVVAQRVGSATRFPSIELGVRSGANSPVARMIYAGPKRPLQPEIDPARAYNRLFGNFTPPATMPGAPPMIDLAKSRQAGALGIVGAQLGRLQNKLGGADRTRIDAHLTALRTLERQLGAGAPTALPIQCVKPAAGAAINANAVADSPRLLTAQLDLIANTLACDLTRVMSLEYRFGDNDDDAYSWLGLGTGHHTMSHFGDSDAAAQANLTKIYTWYADRVAYLLTRLAAVKEADGSTLLDNTLVVWGSEVGKGNNHSFEKVPFVLAGGRNLGLKTGRYVQVPGVQHNRLLTSICQMMGMPEIQTFGTTDTGTGPLPGLV